MTTTSDNVVAASGEFTLGGDMTVRRLGFGAMQLTGPGVWGQPADRDECLRVLRRAVELGVNLIDTADSYGPYVSEDLIREALHPYDGLTIATKAGLTRSGPGVWVPVGRPAYLRQCLEMSLRRLNVERIDLFQLHRIDPDVPLADQVGELRDLQTEGKIRHIGLSEVGVSEIRSAQQVVPIVSVQNLYNLIDRKHEDVVEFCDEAGIGFIPWFPLATGQLSATEGPLASLSAAHSAPPSALALAWLLHRSGSMLPIPGTSSVAHLEENCAAATITLTVDEFESLSKAGEAAAA